MESNIKVFRLIKSLSKTEKRYFKLSLKNNSKANIYVKLFDVMDNSAVYDETEILANCKQIKPHQLENLKSYLYRKILQSLTAYNRAKFETIIVRELISQSEVLLTKGLTEYAMDNLEIAKKKALKYELFRLVIDILTVQESILILIGDFMNWENTLNEKYKYLKLIKRDNKYSELNHKMNQEFYNAGTPRTIEDLKSIKELFETKYLQNPELAPTMSRVCTYHYLRGTYYYLARDYEKALSEAKLVFSHAKEINDAQVKNSNGIIVSYDFVIELLLKLNRLQEAKAYLKDLEAYSVRSKNLSIWREYCLNLCWTDYYIRSKDFSSALNWISNLEKIAYFDLSNSQFHKLHEFFLKIFYVYFVYEQYDNALTYLNIIINKMKNKTDEDLYAITQVLNLIIHYELENYRLIENLIYSTYRYLKHKERLFKFEKLVLDFIRKSTKINSKEDFLQLLSSFWVKIKELKTDPFEKHALDIFDLDLWIQSKIEKKTMLELMKEI